MPFLPDWIVQWSIWFLSITDDPGPIGSIVKTILGMVIDDPSPF